MNKFFSLLIIFLAIILLLGIGFLIYYFYSLLSISEIRVGLEKCSSCAELKEKIKEFSRLREAPYFPPFRRFEIEEKALPAAPLAAPAAKGIPYSPTNIQVFGVDEADIVKTDGRYIYTVSNNVVTISLAWPPEEAKLLAKINWEDNSNPREIFIEKENLLIFGQRWSKQDSEEVKEIRYRPPSSLVFVEIYNLSDPEKPKLKRKIEFEGDYFSSRKIENYVYFVLRSYPSYPILPFSSKRVWPFGLEESEEETKEEIIFPENEEIIPYYRDFNLEKEFKPLVGCTDVSLAEPINSDNFTTVIGFKIDDYDSPISKEVILGGSENIYASLRNLYLANTNYEEVTPSFPQAPDFSFKRTEETIIYKFSLSQGRVKYLTKGEVSGWVLNQFSMDEDNDYFRVATTIGRAWQRNERESSSNVYILDKNLKLIGSLENIAPGEEIYSARFIGKRVYLVTFKTVDPFFVIDLADPFNPKILGYLKIPGYSNYLHPYDENHIIGIGKEVEGLEEEEFAWYQGVKMALFDVSDTANPKEKSKVVIGDRGTDSPILSDHKAFLFDREKNLLVIPVFLAELTEEQKQKKESWEYGEYVFQGSYIYNLTLEKGFELKGRITHFPEEPETLNVHNPNYQIKRNFYISDFLYSVSLKKILINSLGDLAKTGEINIF